MSTQEKSTPSLPVAAKNPEPALAEKLSEGELDMVSSLRNAVNNRGRYSSQVEQYAVGYAAAKCISQASARTEIEQTYENHFGISLQDHLTRNRQERGLSVDQPQQKRGRSY